MAKKSSVPALLMILGGIIAGLLYLAYCGGNDKSGDQPIEPSATTPREEVAPRAPSVTFDITDPDIKKEAERALGILYDRCRLRTIFSDLATIKVSIEDLGLGHYLTRRYGWRHVVRVEPKFRELGDIKGSRWDKRHVGGHSFDFRLGSGTSPGITADKWIGHELCGMDVPRSETGHIEVPELAGLNVGPAITNKEALQSIDFTKLFAMTPAEVHGMWGAPKKDKDGETYIFPDLTIGIGYQDGRAVVAELSSTSISMRALRALGGTTLRRFRVTELNGALYVRDTRLPDTRPDLTALLGAPTDHVRKALGGRSDLPGADFDGYTVVATEVAAVVEELAVTLHSGLEPKKNKAALRKWLGINGDHAIINGHRYRVSFDEMSVVFTRQQ